MRGPGSSADPSRIGTRRDFAHELTLLRESAGLTVRDVARALGVPSSTVSGYFAGHYLPPVKPPDLLHKLLSVCGADDPDTIAEWLAALSRVRRAPGRRPAGAPIPYRGLASFQPEDADWFYGRRALTGVLVGQLRHQYEQGGLLAVVGPSGSGKSSLLRAGLIPALKSGALGVPGSPGWPVMLFTPGARPVHELAGQFAALTGAGPGQLAAALLSEPSRGHGLAREAARPGGSGSGSAGGGGVRDHGRLVVVADQFEEIFTACGDEPERRAFIAALCAAAGGGADHDGGPVTGGGLRTAAAALVVLGLRADFYPHALRYPALVPALQHRQVLVGPMTEAELRSVITEPARRAKLDIDEGLVEVLLRDLAPAPGHSGPAAYGAGTLPLLSHALLTTWERSRRGRLTVADYRAGGGIQGAVAHTAEQVYGGLTPAQQELARQIFIRLVHVADDTADTRRRVPISELSFGHGDAQPVLDVFIGERLITAETGEVGIAHEALLAAWPRLRDWIDNDRAGVRIHRQLTSAAEVWRDSGRDPSALYGGGRLATAADWASDPVHSGDLNILEREFLDASAQRRLAEERAARHRTRRLRRLVAALATSSLAAGFLAVFAYQQKAAATHQRDLAISRQVATEADQLRGTDIALAMQLSLAAYRISPTAEARSSLLAAAASPAATRMLGPAGVEMHAVAFNATRTVLAAGSADGTIRLWDVRRPGHPVALGAPLATSSGGVESLMFDPGSPVLAAGGDGGTVLLWNVADPRRPALLYRLLLKPSVAVTSVAFGAAGRMLAAAGSDGRAYLWDTADLRHEPPLAAALNAGAGQLNAVAFSQDGTELAAGGSSGQVRLWHLARSGLPAGKTMLRSGQGHVIYSVAFSPGGRLLAAGSTDDKVWLWNVAGRRRPVLRRPPLTGPASWIYSVAFSPDGTSIAAGSADNAAYIWNVADGALIARLPHPAPVISVTYGRSGHTLATGDADGVARMWALPGPVMTGPHGSVFTVAFSPGGRDLAVASGDGTVRIWNVADPNQPVPRGQPLTAASLLDGTVAYGRDGLLAAGGANGSISLWDMRDPAHPVRLRAPPSALLSAIQYVTFSRSGQLLAAGSSAGRIELWDVTDAAQPKPLAVLSAAAAGPGHDVFAVGFSPGGRLLASASADGTVRLWNIAGPGRPQQLGPPLLRLTSAIYQVSFSPDGHVLAASGEDHKVRLWDVRNPRNPRLLSVLSGPIGIVYDVSFSPDGRVLATANGDGTVSLWDIADPARPVSIGTLTGFSGAVFAVAFSPSGSTIATGSQDETARLWPARESSAAGYICSVAGEAITRAEWVHYIPGAPYDPPCRARP